MSLKLLPLHATLFNSQTPTPRTAAVLPGTGRRSTARLHKAKATSSSFPTPDRDNRDRGNCDGDRIEEKASSSSSADSWFPSRSQTYALLKQQLAVAAKSEDYEEAARIRDSLKSFEEEEPLLHLRKMLRKAIQEERFEVAGLQQPLPISWYHWISQKLFQTWWKDADFVRLSPILSRRRNPPSSKPYSEFSTLATLLVIALEGASVRSSAIGHPLSFGAIPALIASPSSIASIRVIPLWDLPLSRSGHCLGNRNAYALYPVQLLRRHWIITDANGRTENFWGVGVIGEQPVILPRTGFEYSSACPLSTPTGRMEGEYEMKHIDKLGSPTFNVVIAAFSLSMMGDDTDGPL
ncbi:hypothetical protein ZIOFF_024424 [Zingiber officinale]|uniref:UVR domain-containing protein n=1 Tax=Zingiber officinale TaxID=94328 RepID=A0A8J5HC44_ZINOF|nr:hypothetical protein ZIOFF_024424 [Zingiber officinale]